MSADAPVDVSPPVSGSILKLVVFPLSWPADSRNVPLGSIAKLLGTASTSVRSTNEIAPELSIE
jgi:hypothetical protein